MPEECKKVGLLVAVNSIYSIGLDTLYDILRFAQHIEITFLIVRRPANLAQINNLLGLKNSRKIKVVVVPEIRSGFLGALSCWRIIRKNFRNKKFAVLLGDSINLEERVLISELSKESIFFGFLATMPFVLSRHGIPIERKDNDKVFKKIIKALHEKRFTASLKSKILLLASNFLDFYLFRTDAIAIKNRYVNQGLVKKHFVANDYWAHIIKAEYGEEVISWDPFSKSTTNNSFNIDLKLKKDCILVLGPSRTENFPLLIESLHKLREVLFFDNIKIRPHPRDEYIAKQFQQHLSKQTKLNSWIVDPADSIVEQSNDCVAIYGYASAIIILISRKFQNFTIVDEQYTECECDLRDINFPLLVGTLEGFNRNICFLTKEGRLMSYFPDLSAGAYFGGANISFYDALYPELPFLQNESQN
ncbi:hypothetical protein OAR11_00170 [Alphaproteobacteria bacterium]|nr:hypothetical protein [Alphaproteobacteria bacterium]